MGLSFFFSKEKPLYKFNWIICSTYQQAQPRDSHNEQINSPRHRFTTIGTNKLMARVAGCCRPSLVVINKVPSLLRIIGFLLFFDNNTLSHLNPDILNGRWCWVLQIYAIQQQRSPAFRHHHLTFLGFEQGSGWRIGWVSQDLKMLEGFDLKKKKKKSLLPWP